MRNEYITKRGGDYTIDCNHPDLAAYNAYQRSLISKYHCTPDRIQQVCEKIYTSRGIPFITTMRMIVREDNKALRAEFEKILYSLQEHD